MATLSTPGIASGIDVKSIVSQLVALERAPLQSLQTQATSIRSKVSVYGSLKSMATALGDAADKLSKSTNWTTLTATSSDSSAVGVSASGTAQRTSLSVEVQRLAKAQSTASTPIAKDSPMGSGTLSIQIGNWASGNFAPGSAAAVNVTVAADDTLSDIAAKINDADAGVSATVLRDSTGERLLIRSNDTGETNGFRIQVTDDDGTPNDANGLSRLAYDPGTATGMGLSQVGLNALATINNVAVSSTSNTLSDNLPGMTLTLTKETAAPVEIKVSTDEAAIKKNIEAFVNAYNSLNDLLNTTTKYDAATKVAGTLQGDSTAVGLQNAFRGMMRSVTASSPFSRLLDVGIQAQKDGKLTIDSAKLDEAMDNLEGLQNLFTAIGGGSGSTDQGFGLKVKAFTDGLISANGSLTTRADSLQSALKRNDKEQERVNDRATRAEARYLAQYNAMDAAVGQLNALNAFVTQQVTLWNKSSG
jgi:flagellar hook-associated protein 2